LARTQWAPGAAALAAAARAVEAVASAGQSADAALAAFAPASDRAPIQAITLGSLRWYLRLAPAIEGLLARPSGVPGVLRALLVAAAHQVEYSRHAPQLTVNAAVDAVRVLGRERSCALVNAVLRKFVAQRGALLAHVDRDRAARYAHPAWLVERLYAQWPESAERMLAANNAHPPMTLRVDLSRSTVGDCVQALCAASIESHTIQWMPSAITLDRPLPIADIPGFGGGLVSVQDAGAQIAAGLLGARPGMRVLDACAAPGGKTGHLLELLGETIDLTALDVDEQRVGLIRENLARLRRAAHLKVGDARDPSGFWDGRPFERILVDAPCSSTGVIRRHPDIRLLRRAADVPAFATTQLAILRSVATLLSAGGRILYSTCSVLAEENEQVVARLLEAEPGLSLIALPEPESIAPGAMGLTAGVQLLPGAEAGTDGFYYACIEKTTTRS
jgi:16S rRNA (cytosine967-C5)-methyltransferase